VTGDEVGDTGEEPAPGDTGAGAVDAASRTMFERLLEVQDHDTAIDQLRHRRSALPEQAELARVEQRLAGLEARAAEVQVGRDELGVRQAALEDLIEASRARRGELEKRMFGGQVSAARDLQAMDEEVKHLKQHISELEDREIEIMEELEPIDAELDSTAGERTSLRHDRERLRQAVAAAVVTIDADLISQSAGRQAAAATVPPDLLARYEKLRTTLSGTGAARLVGGSCSGCHLSLPSMEVDRIRKAPPDEIILCDQCGRILVR
jgi:predicted  nucleic acid-binding Zn-ribbon protein